MKNATYSVRCGRYSYAFFYVIISSLFGLQSAFSQCGDTLLCTQSVNVFPYLEDFENGKGGWYDGPLKSFLTETWAFGTPAKQNIQGANSGDSCWVTGGLGFQQYASGEESFVTGPCFDLTGLSDPVMGISINYRTENPFDGAAIQSSVDSGKTWQLVGNTSLGINWYTTTNISSTPGAHGAIQTCPFQNMTGWSGRSSLIPGGINNSWIRAQSDLTGLGGVAQVQLRVAFAADHITGADGIAFDDVVIIEKLPVNLGNDTTLCFGQLLTLDLGSHPNVRYFWPGMALNTTQTLNVATAGTVIGCVEDTIHGVTFCDTINIGFSNTSIRIMPDTTICPGDSIRLDMGNPMASHCWFRYDSTLQMFTKYATSQAITVHTSGVFRAVVSDNAGCTDEDTVAVLVDFVPVINLPPPDTICGGDAVFLCGPNSTQGTIYDWTQNGMLFASTQCIFTSSPGTYNLQITTPGAGCTTSDTFALEVKLAPVVNLGPDKIDCDSVVLNANNPGSDFLWSPGGQTTQTVTLYPPFTAAVQVTNQFGCEATDTVSMALGQPPVVNLPSDTVVCNASSVTLSAVGPNQPTGTSYQWSTSVTAIFSTETITAPGFYTVKVTHPNGCSVTDSVNVTISTLAVNLGQDTSVCDGKSIVLDATFPGATYAWSNGATTPIISVNAGGNFSVTLMDSLGCMAMDDIIVTQRPPYVANFMVDTVVVRLGNSHTFQANTPSGTTSWLWQFGDGTSGSGQMVTHTYTSLNTFTVCLIASDGQCSDTVCSTAGTKLIFISNQDLVTANLDIFPNPNQGSFLLEMKLLSPSKASLGIHDLSGRPIYHKDLEYGLHHKEAITLEETATGIYLLRISTPKGSTYRKIIVK